MNDRSQAGRLASITTALGADVVVLERFTATSRLSDPFLLVADVISEEPIDFESALYQPVLIKTLGVSGIERSFHGLLFGVERHDDAQLSGHYQLIVRPWLAALAETTNVRIFQNQTAVDIIQAVFSSAGYSDFDCSGVTGKYPLREYCVQFRESDFAFVSRLMEEEGLYYFFSHTDSAHTLKVCDGPGAHNPAPGLDRVEFRATASQRSQRRLNIWRWSERLSTGSASVELSEHHFLVPKASNSQHEAASGAGLREASALYDHPAGIGALQEKGVVEPGQLPTQSDRLAKVRLQAARAETRKFFGEGDAFGLNAGDKLTLHGHSQNSLDGDYLAIATTHVFTAETYRSGGGGGDSADLQIHIEATPFDVPWRPQRRTPKPLAGGPQTAVVVGPLENPGATDDTIFVDKHGRVKVQFFWDRQGKRDPKSSCWVRVSQGWADGGFGVVMLPRIGQEVIVDFLDGDPDRPIVTGRVYNADRMPPYTLPDRKTVSTIKSRTVGPSKPYDEAEEPPQSSDVGFNELRFEDKGGEEEVFMHAQRDMKAWVRLDDNRKVGRDQALRVGRNRDTHIKKNKSLTVEEGDETREVSKGSRTTKVHKDETLTVATGNMATTVSQGDLSVSISSGKATIEAAQSIELKVGSTTIKLSPTGIEMSGLTIKIDAKTALSAEGGLTSEVKAGMSLTLNGAMVLIN